MAEGTAQPTGSTIHLAEVAEFALGPVVVKPALRSVQHGDRRFELQPRVMQVLIALAEARPEVVSREQLIARCWNGRIVGDDALNRCIVLLRTLARDAEEAFEIRNVARVGYRLVVPEVELDAKNPALRRWLWLAGAVMATVLVGSVGTRLVSTMPLSGAAAPSEARRLELAGQALLRTGNPQMSGDARVLFEQSLEADPGYAPAWVGLAEARRSEASLRGPEHVLAVMPRAHFELRRALALAPNLSEAHGQMGAFLGFQSNAARAHLTRAAALAPNHPQAQLWLASVRRAAGDFPGEIAAYRRAHAIDGAWYRPVRDLAIATAEMGDRAGALQIARLAKAPFPGCSGMPARIAHIYGDMAESARCAAESAKQPGPWAAPARVVLASTRLALGLSRDSHAAAPLHLIDTRPPQGRVWVASAPSSAQWRRQNRSPDAALIYRMDNFVAAKLLLNDGRHEELVATYLSPSGLLGVGPRTQIAAVDLPAIPLLALALQRSGHRAEADRLLARGAQAIAEAQRHGPVPFTFDAEAAALMAVRGDADAAIAALQRARARGWVNNFWGDLLDLRQEPAFSGLRDDRRFEAIAASLDQLYVRERREMLALGL